MPAAPPARYNNEQQQNSTAGGSNRRARERPHIAVTTPIQPGAAQVYLSLGWLDQAGFLLDSMNTPTPNALSGQLEWLKGMFQAFENVESVHAFDHCAVAASRPGHQTVSRDLTRVIRHA